MVQVEFPIQWLKHQPRTKIRKKSQFGNHNASKAGDYLTADLKRLGARNCVISSNLEPRQRGDGFYANQRVNDPGVVVYFDLKGEQKAMACDKWNKPEHNLWALYLSVQAIRGLERWGGSEILGGLFTGFKALPSPDQVIVQNAPNYFEDCETLDDAHVRRKSLAKQLHPDNSEGDNDLFIEMQRQYQMFMKQHSG